jgi:hypothetical protein
VPSAQHHTFDSRADRIAKKSPAKAKAPAKPKAAPKKAAAAKKPPAATEDSSTIKDALKKVVDILNGCIKAL